MLEDNESKLAIGFTESQKQLRNQLIRFSEDIEVGLLPIYDAWIYYKNDKQYPLYHSMVSYLTRELLDVICKFETNKHSSFRATEKVDTKILLENDIPKNLQTKFTFEKEKNSISFKGEMKEKELKKLLSLSKKQDFKYCVHQLYNSGKCNQQKRLSLMLKRLDPKGTQSIEPKALQKKYKELRDYFNVRLHIQRKTPSFENFDKKIDEAEEFLRIITMQQIEIFNAIDGLIND